MESNAAKQTHPSMTLPEWVRHSLGGDHGTVWIITAPAQNWPELTNVNDGEIVVSADDLIRLAVWSASKCCTALLSTHHATLLPKNGEEVWELRCHVIANASLATPRPLSGFLLKPVELRVASRDARDIGRVHRIEENEHRAAETRLALFNAFPPPTLAGEQPPHGRPLPA
ncbi:hypothetical protein [Rhizobium sp. BK251]|uniref:hypothetical protein n=1 Tax=Rhizobium sp. BK251 TaxID=2512125 RepID=UPI0010462FCE|nr:hypothetical protein [Rhizobium sp. BK251]TCL62227.1 hypothetical protein EV286_1236 [Rhizobium sp. BK251]